MNKMRHDSPNLWISSKMYKTKIKYSQEYQCYKLKCIGVEQDNILKTRY